MSLILANRMTNLLLLFTISCIILTEISGDISGCDYFDTVNVTNYHKYENGSYQYEDVLIPKEDIGEYDYEILFDGVVERVPKHTRGCVCNVKPCIRFCCHPKKVLVQGERNCQYFENGIKYSPILNITLNNGTLTQRNISEFLIQQHLPVPCTYHIHLDAEYEPQHRWTLYENGNFLNHFQNELLSKRDYCLQPKFLTPDLLQIVPHQCQPPLREVPSYVQMVSVFFMLLIICVYFALPNFKGAHFKCCTCYFSCLSICFIMLICVRFEWVKESNNFCVSFGFIGYYLIIATFLWLLIINYNLWKAFCKIGVAQKSKFLHYNIFVWSVAAVLLLITGAVEFIYKDSEWIPGFGVNDCWINTSSYSAMIYYYGPISMLIMVNVTLFMKTAVRILTQNRENRRQLMKSECQCNLKNLTNFAMFARLFVTVGVLWILEITSYIWSLIYENSEGLFIADVVTSSQGVLLFAATIFKEDILKSLVDRFWKISKRDEPNKTAFNQIPTATSGETEEE